MNIHETVSKFLQLHAFTISPDGKAILVRHQDNVAFLTNKLGNIGLADIQVYYSDGRRHFSANELKSVIVIGTCHDRNLVFSTLDRSHSGHPFTKLVYLDVHPSPLRPTERSALEWARRMGVETKPVRVEWKLGKNAAAIRYGKLFAKRSRTRPGIVVAFTDKEITAQVRLAQKAGAKVVFA